MHAPSPRVDDDGRALPSVGMRPQLYTRITMASRARRSIVIKRRELSPSMLDALASDMPHQMPVQVTSASRARQPKNAIALPRASLGHLLDVTPTIFAVACRAIERISSAENPRTEHPSLT